MASLVKAPSSAFYTGDPKEFATEMIKMVNDKAFSDTRFTVGEEGRIFYAHKCLLAARCEVFRAMFEKPTDENEQPDTFVLSETNPDIFMAMLEFIYTNCCSLSTDIVIDVLAVSTEYGLDELTKMCVQFMRDTIAVDTVCEFIQAALTYQQNTLQSECLVFTEQYTKDVFQSTGFNELSEDALSFVLQSDQLRLDEEEILAKVIEWATVNSVVTGQSLGEVALKVICHVRFGLLDPEKLSQVERDNQERSFVPVTLISGAWKFHALKRVNVSDPQTRPRAGTLPRESLRVLGLAPQ